MGRDEEVNKKYLKIIMDIIYHQKTFGYYAKYSGLLTEIMHLNYLSQCLLLYMLYPHGTDTLL